MVVNVEMKCLPWEIDADRGRLGGPRDGRRAAPAATGTFIVSSFDLGAVDLARAHAPEVATGWLTHGQEVGDGGADRGRARSRWLNPDVAPRRWTRGRTGIAAAHAAGVRVGVWTVDDPKAARALAAAGVDIIISNVPDVILRGARPRDRRS